MISLSKEENTEPVELLLGLAGYGPGALSKGARNGEKTPTPVPDLEQASFIKYSFLLCNFG